jgi:hypothetical protein
MREIPPTAQNLREQATLVIESFQDRRFQFFPCEALHRDLLKLRVEEKSLRDTSGVSTRRLQAAEKVEVRDVNQFRADLIEQSELHKRFPNLPGVTERSLQLLVASLKRIQGYRQQIAEIDAKLGTTAEQQAVSREEQRLQAMREQQKEEQQRLMEAYGV